MSQLPGAWRVALAVARRPSLWPVATLMALRLAAPGWWRHWPPVPLPDPDYWRLRMTVAYGGLGDHSPDPVDVADYLTWCRANWRRSSRSLG